MAQHSWIAAAELLRAHCPAPPPPGPRYAWQTLVDVVAGAATRKGRTGELPFEEALVASPAATAAASLATVTSALEQIGRPTRSARAFVALAQWWLRDPRREAEQPAAWQQPLEKLRLELRSVPGGSHALADRILLHVGGLPAYPIDRATVRVVCRHGWLDPTAPYDEWQAFCAAPASSQDIDLGELSARISQLGREHCGPSPKCESCPLAPLLPATGAILFEEGCE
ncbi:MAG: hypothetical protein ACT4QC_15750 [Planctomycetaceae bacterium]